MGAPSNRHSDLLRDTIDHSEGIAYPWVTLERNAARRSSRLLCHCIMGPMKLLVAALLLTLALELEERIRSDASSVEASERG